VARPRADLSDTVTREAVPESFLRATHDARIADDQGRDSLIRETPGAPNPLEGRRARRLVVDARDRAAARSALEAAGYAVTVDGRDGGLALAEARAVEAPDEVARVLVAAGTAPLRLAVEQEDLEDHFLRLIGASS